MKVVIDISEDLYNKIKILIEELGPNMCTELERAVYSGQVLHEEQKNG